jgi:DNA-binding GntR family transcriptional regulator
MADATEDISQGEAAYARLYDAIRAGEYQPGDRLRETDVAARLSLSRTPVREALRRLEADGIVEHKARIGAMIRRLSHPELIELYEMRMVLESTAAALAAKHAVPAEIDELEDLNAAIAGAVGNPTKAAAINQSFHRCIYMAARNRFLVDSARGLNNALMLLGPTTLAGGERLTTVCKEHSDIIAAIRAGDGGKAGEAAGAHLQMSLRHRLKVMHG